jgi:hypothetical protein
MKYCVLTVGEQTEWLCLLNCSRRGPTEASFVPDHGACAVLLVPGYHRSVSCKQNAAEGAATVAVSGKYFTA